MGLISSSKNSAKNSPTDNRSMASDSAIAAGGNLGSITRDVFGDKVFNMGSSSPWKPILICSAAAFALWKIPITRRFFIKLLRIKNV